MTAGDHKLRIALAVVDPAEALEAAVAALLAEGIAATRLGLIVLATTAATLTQRARQGGALQPLINELAPLANHAAGEEVLASPALIGPWRSGSRIPALWGQNGSAVGRSPRLAPDLERYVRRGAAILTVEAESASDQWHSARILLTRSSAPVLALECTVPTQAH